MSVEHCYHCKLVFALTGEDSCPGVRGDHGGCMEPPDRAAWQRRELALSLLDAYEREKERLSPASSIDGPHDEGKAVDVLSCSWCGQAIDPSGGVFRTPHDVLHVSCRIHGNLSKRHDHSGGHRTPEEKLACIAKLVEDRDAEWVVARIKDLLRVE